MLRLWYEANKNGSVCNLGGYRDHMGGCQIIVPFWIPSIMRHLVFKGIIVLTAQLKVEG